MKLVVSHLETQRTYVTREFYYITKDLVSNYGWKHIEINKLWNGSRTVRDNLIEEFGELPAVMLFSEAYEFLQARATDIQRLDCRRCFLADDLHWWDDEMRQMKSISFSICETVLSTYAYAWSTFYPELAGVEETGMGAALGITGFHVSIQSQSGGFDFPQPGNVQTFTTAPANDAPV